MTRAGSADQSPTMDDVAAEAERLIERVAPGLKRVTKWGMPWFAGRDLVVLVGAFSKHVGVEFWRGSTLPDPDGLLEGTGKNLRHVKLRTLDEAGAPALGRLIRRAVAIDRREPPRAR